MRQFIRLTAIIFVLFCGLQVTSAADEKWRPVTPEELAMTAGKVDPNADAEAIFWEVAIDASIFNKLRRDTYVRVKILKDSGRERFAKVDLPYDNASHEIKDVYARVIRPNGSVVEVAEKDIFERDVVKVDGFKAKSLSFAFPNLEPGVIVEYRYREIFVFGRAEGMRLDFQLDLPAQTVRYLYRARDDAKPVYSTFNFDGFEFKKGTGGFYQAERNNVPAFVAEPFSIPALNIRPWVLIQSKEDVNELFRPSYNVWQSSFRFGIKEPEKYWSRVAAQSAGWLKSYNRRSAVIERTVTEVTRGATTNEEKVALLLNFCRTGLKRVPQKSPFDRPTIDEMLRLREATSFQIYEIFGTLVKSLGLNVAFAKIAPRSSVIFDPSMLNAEFLRDPIIAVEVEPQVWRFYNYDLSYPPGMLLWSSEGSMAMLLSEDSFVWVKTPMTPAEKSLSKRTGAFQLGADGSLEGNVRIEYSGHPAMTRRSELSNYNKTKTGDDPAINSLKLRLPQAVVSEVKYENENDPWMPLVVTYKISVPKYAERTGKRLFVKPSFFEVGVLPIFTASERKHPIDFPYPYSNQDEVSITLPEGYELDSADRPANVADPGNITSLKVNIGIDLPTRTIVYRRNFHFGGGKTPVTRFEASSYGALKNLFDMFHKTDNHVISLKAN